MSGQTSSEEVLYARMLARLRLRHLRLLIALDECRALGAAAAEVGMSQPAATQMLKELESLLEVRLYERHSRGLRPTEASRLLAAQARFALGNMRHAAGSMIASARGLEAMLNVGAIPAAISGLLAARLPALKVQLPHLRLAILEGTPESLMAQLNAGLVQIALVREPADGVSPPFRFSPLTPDRLAIVAAPAHPVARRRSVRLAELANYPWSLPFSSQSSGVAFEQACAMAGFVPLRSNIQSISTALLAVLTGDGRTLAAVPRSLVAESIAAGTVVEVPVRPPIALPVLGAVHIAVQPSPSVRAFVEALAQHGDSS
jgi:DNA-binding transcriptional LysR family regulator